MFEGGERPGGHTNTIDVEVDGQRFPVDTGFLVFNERTYPNLIALFDLIGVSSVTSDMSFSVCMEEPRLEWAGTSIASLFAQ
jgi:predicted NAD/FAD-binding protein